MKNSSETELRATQDGSLKWAERFGLAIFLGLVIEIVAWLWLEGWSWKVFWTAFLPDVLIAIGVGGELLFSARAKNASDELGRRADAKIAEANERAAMANERAEKLELERVKLLTLLANRRLSTEQQEQIAEVFKSWAVLPGTDKKQSVAVFPTNPQDFECAQFANDIALVFDRAGWDVNRSPVTWGMSIAVQGIGLLSSSNPRGTSVASLIMRAFMRYGVFTHFIPPRQGCEEQGMPPEEIATTPACSQVSIFVGVKPGLQSIQPSAKANT